MSSALFALFLPDRTRQKQHGALAQLSDGGEAFLSAARDDRSQRKKTNTWGRTSRLKNDGCFIGYVSDRVTCPFFGFYFRGTKRDKVKGGQEVHVTCFIFFSNIDLKSQPLSPAECFGTWCAGWELSAPSSFHQQPRAVVLNATKITRRPFKG